MSKHSERDVLPLADLLESTFTTGIPFLELVLLAEDFPSDLPQLLPPKFTVQCLV